MAKLIGFFSLLLLSGSSQLIHVTVSPYETTITVHESTLKQHATSPLSRDQWLMRQALRSVPAFESDTSIEQVRSALIDQNLIVLIESPDYLVVREGVPLIDLRGPIRDKFLYGFENGRLTLGPLTFRQAQTHFVSTRLTSKNLETLRMFADADTSDPLLSNEFAWLLATYPDPDLRDGQLAIEYATRTENLDEVAEWAHVDTLAAAYAAAGDFRNAVLHQRRAIDLNYEDDIEANQRLELYRNRQPYKSPLSHWTGGEVEDIEFAPKPDLLVAASAGSPEAQWRLATFYLENDIDEGQGMMNPGIFWLHQAAENGHPMASNEIGFCYLMALCGVDNNFPEAAKWFERAALEGDATGGFNYARVLVYGQGIARDEILATQWLQTAADSGITAAAFHAAMRHREGVGMPPNPLAQTKYMKQVEDAAYGPADFLLDDHYFQQFFGGASVAAALDRSAVNAYEMADALVILSGQIDRASETAEGSMVVQFGDTAIEYDPDFRPELVLHLIRIAAALGSTEAQLEYATYFEDGRVVQRSLPEANYWRKRAAQ